MALFDIKTQTTVGRNYLTQAVAGSKIIWDNVKVSKDYFSNPVGLTDLTNIIISSPIDYAKQVSNEQFDIGGHVDSSAVHSDTVIKTWGLYGHVGTDSSQLLAVLSSQSGQTLYANTKDVQTIKETFSLVFPNPSNTPISFVVSNSGFALDDNVVHTTGDETASGVKNFQDGVKSGGKNVVTQNGDDTINVTNGLTNNAIEPVDKSKIKDSIIQVSLSSSNNIDNLENDGRYPFDSVTIAKIDPNNKISGYLDQSTNGSTIIQGTVYTVGTTKYVKYRSKSNGVWSDWNTSASVADMEVKLANKVIDNKNGSIQVNGKTITPADNSKVVHTTDTSNWQKQAMFNPGDYKIDSTSPTTDFATLLKSKYNKGGIVCIRESNGRSYAKFVDAVVICEGNGFWYAYGITGGNLFVHRQITPYSDSGWVINADDSKVAHLSGANNFDTVPTVNNNPLLLASSLPSDLARTGQANTFSSLQTFSQGVKTLQTGSYSDANSLVNEGLYYNTNSSIKNGVGSLTTGYIQVMSGGGEIVRQIMYSDTDGGLIYDRTSQDGGSSWSNWVLIVTYDLIPSNVALTNRSQTFAAAQTFSSAPTVQDTSSPKGDNQVALMGDLKSVKESAWRQLDSSLITFDIASTIDYTSCLYKIDPINNKIYIHWIIKMVSRVAWGQAHLDFSSVVSNFTSEGTGGMMLSEIYDQDNDARLIGFSISGSRISFAVPATTTLLASGHIEDCWFGYDTLLI